MKYKKINLFLPTYKRVENGKLPRFLNSCINKVSMGENICITFLVNVDDKETRNYLSTLVIPVLWEVLYVERKTPHLGKMYNQIYEQTRFKDSETLVSMVGDDMEWETSGYDLAILNAINKVNGMGLVYCNDAYVQGSKLCVNLFTSRKFVETTKHPFMCELFAAYFIDTVWMKVARKTKTAIYLKDVILKHHHCSKNPKNADITSQRLKKEQFSFTKGYKMVDEYIAGIVKELNRKL